MKDDDDMRKEKRPKMEEKEGKHLEQEMVHGAQSSWMTVHMMKRYE